MRKISLIAAMLLMQPAVPAFAGQAQVAPAADPHFIAIDGGHNFRDVGGYRTSDGRMVRRGAFYRSGSMAELTPQGMRQLGALRVGAIVDLRSTAERRTDMSNWLAASGQGYWARDYALDQTGFAALMGGPGQLTVERVHAAMAGGYRSMPKILAPSYRELFARLLSGRGAVVVNCTAGKDRTGIATALVLTALGVPYDAVREDFLLSNRAIRTSQNGVGDAAAAQYAALPREVLIALGGVDGSYLDAAFDQMRRDYGSVEGYLQQELGVGPRQLAQLRRRLVV